MDEGSYCMWPPSVRKDRHRELEGLHVGSACSPVKGYSGFAGEGVLSDHNVGAFGSAYPISKNAFAHVKPGDPARALLIKAKGWLQQCPSNDVAWYLILRARELLGCDPRQTFALAKQAHRALLRSVWARPFARACSVPQRQPGALAIDPDHV